MHERQKVINELLFQLNSKEVKEHHDAVQLSVTDAKKILALLKEQEKKRITLHKKHVITWGRNDEFSMRKLY